MKLITKTTLWYLLLSALVLCGGAFVALSLIKESVQRETDHELRGILWVTKNGLYQDIPAEKLQNRRIKINEITERPVVIDSVFQDTMVFLKRTNRIESFRKLVASTRVKEKYYKIEIIDIIFEQDDLIDIVRKIIIRLFLFLCVALIIGGFFISKKLLQPFEELLVAIDKFSLRRKRPLKLPKTSTAEFVKLNQFLENMTHKAQQEYDSLKEFSENASHEMQTPIAIAQGKLEILLETPELREEQLQLIESAQRSISKLSKLGHSLTLLTKIENQELNRPEQPIDFSAIVNEITDNFEELSTLQNIQLKRNVSDNVQLLLDPIWADVLVTNLLKNAFQHNDKRGLVIIELGNQQLHIRNSGKAPDGPVEELFNRFKKRVQSADSLGLGLAIVKSICDANQLDINYHYQNDMHEIIIDFSKSSPMP